ncbi:MAG: hypothetical protein KDK70_43210, partial [Myxococcales bacterium]|nr:hypothetical protein [Myxococcales bacterium]
RRLRWRGALALGLAAPLVWLAWAGRAPAGATCAEVDDTLAAVWSDARREAVAAAFMATRDPGATVQLARVVRQLDARTTAWHAAAREACEATAQGESADPHLDQRLQCLQTALDETDTAIEALASADARTVARADAILPSLTPLPSCADPAYLDAVHERPADPSQAAAVQQLRRDTARARGRLSTHGDLDATVDALRGLHERARAMGHAPLEASTGRLLGRALHLRGDSQAAVAELEPAYFAAQRLDDPAGASDAAALLAQAHGHGLGQLDEALRWSRHAEAAARALGDPTEQALALLIRGELLYTAERYEPAERT